MNLRKVIGLTLSAFMLLQVFATVQAQEYPVELKIKSPQKSGEIGVLLNEDWPLTFKIKVQDAVGFVDTDSSPDELALVYSDPDGCLDMRDFGSSGPYESGCSGPDEQYIAFNVDRQDAAAERDSGQFCLPEDQLRLADSPETTDPSLSNKVYLNIVVAQEFPGPPEPPELINIRPFTGGPLDPANNRTEDCYGYGADEDLESLVVMADVGAARFFMPDFTPIPGKIKNMAGFLSNVTYEVGNKNGISSIYATMFAERGMFESIVLFDPDVTDPAYAGADFLRQIDGGPIEAFNYENPVGSPGSVSESIGLASTTPYVEVKIRAVMVDGPAPNEIVDMNGDLKYTAEDVELMGHTLISNQVSRKIVVGVPAVIQDLRGFECAAVFKTDLDGNGLSGVECQSGSGGSRTRTRR